LVCDRHLIAEPSEHQRASLFKQYRFLCRFPIKATLNLNDQLVAAARERAVLERASLTLLGT